jgi:hypothetical protein
MNPISTAWAAYVLYLKFVSLSKKMGAVIVLAA